MEMAASEPNLQPAREILEVAGERQRKIDAEVARVEALKAQMDEQRKNKGRGRPSTQNAQKYKSLDTQLSRLKRGLLPGEIVAPQGAPRTTDETRASAVQHCQHHAAAGNVPTGRPSPEAGRDRGGGAAAAADGGNIDGAGDGDDAGGDDDEEDPNFRQYYAVTPTQRTFNNTMMHEYMKKERDRRISKIEPYPIIGGGCAPESIGVGAVHIFAPHLHMGLPLPPCPRHGWRSVDEQKLRTHGCCPARRVFAQTCDEWLSGVRIICGICEGEKREAEEVLAEMEEDDEMEGTSELQEARAEVADITYSYRSYNPKSIELYAQRYYWYIASLPYVVLNKRTAVTRVLARRIMRACAAGSNPTDMAEELLELKSEWFDLLRAQESARSIRTWRTLPCLALCARHRLPP